MNPCSFLLCLRGLTLTAVCYTSVYRWICKCMPKSVVWRLAKVVHFNILSIFLHLCLYVGVLLSLIGDSLHWAHSSAALPWCDQGWPNSTRCQISSEEAVCSLRALDPQQPHGHSLPRYAFSYLLNYESYGKREIILLFCLGGYLSGKEPADFMHNAILSLCTQVSLKTYLYI